MCFKCSFTLAFSTLLTNANYVINARLTISDDYKHVSITLREIYIYSNLVHCSLTVWHKYIHDQIELTPVGWISAERSQGLKSHSSQNILVVCRCCQSPHKWPNPENPLVIPDFLMVVDNSSTKAPSRVNSSPSNRNSGQMNHKHSKPNRQRSQNRHVRVPCTPLWVGG